MNSTDGTGVTTFATPNDLDIVVTRVLTAPRRLVWDAFTNPAHVPKWLLGPPGWEMPICEIDLRAGGAWRYVYRKPGTEMTLSGTYREVAPSERLVSTESWGPQWPETVNTMTLDEAGGLTTMTITMHYPTMAARDAALRTGVKDGMNHAFVRLDTLLGSLT